MSAKIKLQRIGTRNRPAYRVVVQDEAFSTSGKVVEVLGQYNTLKEPTVFNVDREKTLAWIKKGAVPTGRVRILLGKAGILPPIDLASLPKRKKKGEAPAETAPAESAPTESAPTESVPASVPAQAS